ncbi:MAG TPA: hypothetical protein VLA92_01000, partial [Candidatus Saccharimonadales bacterium]|nr:hypothetical protein [Candidatus Saccharimonadales bacterium]
MGRLQDMERQAWRLSPFGSSSPSFRPPLWRFNKKDPADPAIEWSPVYGGDRQLSGVWRRNWDVAAILEIEDGAIEGMLKSNPGSRPAVGFKLLGRLGVGALENDAIGRMEDGVTNRLAHGMRTGPEDVRFCMGVLSVEGEFKSLPAGALVPDVEVVPVATFDDEGSAYRNVNF